MKIEVCSRSKMKELAGALEENAAVISIVSAEEADEKLEVFGKIKEVLPLRFNDLESETDEEGIPYGRLLPKAEDFSKLKAFVDSLDISHLFIHCHEGSSRSAALALAVWEYRKEKDLLITHQSWKPNRLVYRLACEALGIERSDLRMDSVPEEDHLRLFRNRSG